MNTSIRSPWFNARRAASVAAAAGLLATIPALAQSSSAGGSFDRPLAVAAQPATPRSTGDTTMVITSSENGKTYSVKVHNNEVSAEVDGKAVPADRIDRKGDVVIIKDKDGNAEKTFDVGVRSSRSRGMAGGNTPLRNFTFQPAPEPGATGSAGSNWVVTTGEPPNPPPVMVGITMSDPDSSLAEHLGVNEDEVFIIDRVVEGLPAAKAGLEPHDVVTEIDGTKPASQERFRETLRSKKAGDSLALTVLRKGQEKKLKIELAAYDRSKLAPMGVEMLTVPSDPDAPGGDGRWLRALGGAGMNDDVRARIEEALKAVQHTDKAMAEEHRRVAEQALTKAMESLAQSRALAADRSRAMNEQFFAVPGDRDVTRRLERLGDQLEKLNHRLEEIERRLSEKK